MQFKVSLSCQDQWHKEHDETGLSCILNLFVSQENWRKACGIQIQRDIFEIWTQTPIHSLPYMCHSLQCSRRGCSWRVAGHPAREAVGAWNSKYISVADRKFIITHFQLPLQFNNSYCCNTQQLAKRKRRSETSVTFSKTADATKVVRNLHKWW